MDISSLVKSQMQLAQLAHSASAPAAGNAATSLMAPATERITKQLESTNVQLSAYGQIKSAFAGVQAAAGSLGTSATSKSASSADIQKAAQAFVDAYNKANQAVAGATGTARQPGALASDLRARAAGNDLAQSLTSGSGRANLKQAGITLNSNGTLTLDAKALQQALQSNGTQTKSALASLGQQVGGAAGRELASTGNVGTSVGKLTNRAQSLAAQQTALQQQTASLQAALEKQSGTLNYVTANGLAAYQSLLG